MQGRLWLGQWGDLDDQNLKQDIRNFFEDLQDMLEVKYTKK